MKKISNEIINQYLDNELDEEKRQSVKKLIANSPQNEQEYRLLQLLDDNLRKMKPNYASRNFTDDLMGKLHSSMAKTRKMPGIIIFNLASLVMPLLIIIGTIIYNLLSKPNFNTEKESIIYSLYEMIITGYEKLFFNLNFNPFSILWIGFAFILSLALYFLIEELNRTKYSI